MSVLCPACGHSNPAANRFCGSCGSPLTVACPSCGTANPASNRFCGSCGAALSTAAPAGQPAVASAPTAEKERRLVTILFADLVGSTTIGETLDPEEVLDLVGTAQAALAETVVRYGGYVAKYLGDGLMALFGAPVAREDDAERAVLAGLEMQQALAAVTTSHSSSPSRLQLRIGITSGEVIAGAIAGSYDVMGDAANTAARLQGAAQVGGVLVGEETMQLAQRRIRFGERQALQLKGKAEPVAAYPALGLQGRVVERWETWQRTPLVDREGELAHVVDAWKRARRGEGRILTVVAEAGVGKSRLVAEAVERIESDGPAQILRARCLSYGQQVSLWLIIDLVSNLCSIREEDERSQVRSRITATVDDVLAAQDEDTRAAAVDVLGELLGLPAGSSPVGAATAQIRRQVLVQSLRLFLAALCERSPTVLVLEDLHWADAASTDVLKEIVQRAQRSRLLVLATQRPGWVAPWTEWEWSQQMEVTTLDNHQAARLAEAVLGGLALSSELERYVAERAGGNPFFLEELLRSLQEAGDLVQQEGHMRLAEGAEERMPSTLTEVLLARLDRLEQQVRAVAQTASVIGRDFAVRLLARLVGQDPPALVPPLSALQQAEIAFPRGHDHTDPSFVFKHATIRDVAYNTLLVRRRQTLHAITARAIEQLYPADEHVETIAYHYSMTEEHAEAALWLERAGDRAASVYANEAALAHYEAARQRLQAIGAEPAALARVDEKQGSILRIMARHDDALALLERAGEVYQSLDDLEAVRRVTAQIGSVHTDRATPEAGELRIRQVLESLDHAEPSHGLAALQAALQRLLLLSGRYSESLEVAPHAAGLAEAVGDTRLRVGVERNRAMALQKLGHVREALQALEEAIPLAEEVGDLETLRVALIFGGVAYAHLGQFERCRAHFQRALEVALRVGDMSGIAFTMGMVGHATFQLGDWGRARELLEQAAAISSSIGPTWFSAYPLLGLGELCLAEGRWEEASRHLEAAVEFAERSNDLQAIRIGQGHLAERDLLENRPEAALERLQPLLDRPGLEEDDVTSLLPRVAWAHLEVGDEAQADEALQQAIERARRQYNRRALVLALWIRAMALNRRGRWAETASTVEEGLSLAGQMVCPYLEARFLEEYGRMHAHRREMPQSRERLEQALAIYRRLGAKPGADRTEQGIAALDRPSSEDAHPSSASEAAGRG